MSTSDFFSKITYLMLELNSQCNLRCRHCTREELKLAGLREPKFLSEKELRYLLEQLKNCPVDTIKLEGLSEPMLFPDFGKRTEVIREYFPKAHLIVITNLQYAPEKTSLLQTLKVIDALYLSVDGTEDVYEKIRKDAKYSRFIKSLEIIKEIAAPEELRKIHLNFTATAENFLELPKIYELQKKYDLASVRINLVQNWDENKFNSHSFSNEGLEFLKTYQKDIKGVAGWNYSDCFWIFNGLVIDVEGNVRQCVLNTTQKPLGNAFATPLREIFNGSALLNDARAKLSQNQSVHACRTCDYKSGSALLEAIFSGLERKNNARPILR